MSVQHAPDVPMASTSMDINQAPQSHTPDISPELLLAMATPHPNIPLQTATSHIIHEMAPSFPNKADHPSGMITPMHVSMPDLSSPVYMTSMDVLEPSPTVRPPAPTFIPDFPPQCDPFAVGPQGDSDMTLQPSNSRHSSSVSPPQSQVPSPSIHGLASSYSVGGISSLASALDTTGIPSGGRSRAGSSVSPSTAPLAFVSGTPSNQPLSMPFPPSDGEVVPLGKQEDPQEGNPDTHLLLGKLLKSIAETASSAGDACRMRQGAEASSKVDKLKSEISMVARLMSMSLSDNKFPPQAFMMPNSSGSTEYSPSIAPIPEQHPLTFPPVPPSVDPSAMDLSGNLRVPDASRKRCASAVEEERIVKSLKREPQDDTPLPIDEGMGTIPPATPLLPVETSPLFSSAVPLPANAVRVHALTPPSAPPSPPTLPSGPFTSPPSFSPPKQQPVVIQPAIGYPSFVPSASLPSLDFGSNLTAPIAPAAHPFPPALRSSWSDTVSTPRHRHSLSGSSISGSLPDLQALPVAGPPSVQPTGAPPFPPLPTQPQMLPANAAPAISPPLGRMSRSGSINGPFPNPFAYGFAERPEPGGALWPEISRGAGPTSAPTALGSWYSGSQDSSEPPTSTPSRSEAATSTRGSPPSDDDGDDDDDDDDDDGSPSRRTNQLPSADSPSASSSGSDVPQEYRAEVDRIFFEYLNKICSNLDATDSKGEPIHQTLMAKKMQRLDESPDFRPFKFRIQAFTHAFLEELARQGYPEEKIPMKKIRNYLWRQQYILRFNEDGKKAKSKGNHIWNIEAKKAGDGKWEFRPFHRKLAGTPPGVAYCGLRWSWTPRVWDPQASWTNIPVQYSSPSLPPWLSWKDDVLSGVPPPDAESCEITAEAKFVLEGQEGQLSLTFTLNIAPVSAIDSSFSSHSRRPSIGSDIHVPRRSTSDSVLPQGAQRSSMSSRALTSLGPQSAEAASQGAQVMKVLTTAAQRVAHERQSQLISSFPTEEGEIQDLVKQQHVLTRTANAYDKEFSGQLESHDGSRGLAVAAQTVVLQAAQTVLADRTAGVVGAPATPSQSAITVNEVSVKTQDAVAQAVKLHGTSSTEFDIMVTAASILQEARLPVSPPGMLDASQLAAIEPPRPHSTGSLPSRSFPSLAATSGLPLSLPPLSEYDSLS